MRRGGRNFEHLGIWIDGIGMNILFPFSFLCSSVIGNPSEAVDISFVLFSIFFFFSFGDEEFWLFWFMRILSPILVLFSLWRNSFLPFLHHFSSMNKSIYLCPCLPAKRREIAPGSYFSLKSKRLRSHFTIPLLILVNASRAMRADGLRRPSRYHAGFFSISKTQAKSILRDDSEESGTPYLYADSLL